MRILIPILVIVAIFVGLQSIFVVKETEYAVKFRLGEILRADYEPGLHFKTPFINNVRKFDRRLVTLDMPPEQLNTAEQKYVDVDYYVQWRINDPASFYTSTSGGDFNIARSRLAQLIRNDLREEFAQRSLSEVVSEQRRDMMNSILQRADQRISQFGIDLVDVRIKKIELTEAVLQSVFDRMETQRTEFANELRSLGRERAEEIEAEADRRVRVLLAEAERDAARIRGEGDARATDIYATAYERDPEFYAFMRSLEAYRNSFGGERDVLLLDTESDFFRYFDQQR
ncbi:MAG: protease modulator HflC [Wenzhouxiangellaceae bacterium]|nr:protease modulator HflC [Wenzhouxiangellaceae bacterium]